MRSPRGTGRLVRLMLAGLVDSLCLSVAWTVLVLEVTAGYGLAAAGACSAAMLVGVALSAPVAGWAARRLDGRGLLRAAAGGEAVLRVGVFVLLFSGAPVWLLALCVAAMNVTAWTGYAGMRAEVAAASAAPSALTWYGTVVAAVEAAGVALAALLPTTGGRSPDAVLAAVMAVYVLALVPTVVVAGGSPVRRAAGTAPRAGGPRRLPRLRPRATPAVAGVLLMASASAPTLLAVALAAQLHGRAAVGPAAIAFTAGSLAAPAVAARVHRRGANHLGAWTVCAAGMVAGWVLAPLHVAWLCLAQLAGGLGMTTLEGLLDTSAAQRHPGEVTGALARATAGRALGSAAGTALLPLLLAGHGVTPTLAVLAAAMLLAVPVAGVAVRLQRRRAAPRTAQVAAAATPAPACRTVAARPVAARVPAAAAAALTGAGGVTAGATAAAGRRGGAG